MPFAAGIGGLVWEVGGGDGLPIESLVASLHEKLVFVLRPRGRGVVIMTRWWRADSLLWCGRRGGDSIGRHACRGRDSGVGQLTLAGRDRRLDLLWHFFVIRNGFLMNVVDISLPEGGRKIVKECYVCTE